MSIVRLTIWQVCCDHDDGPTDPCAEATTGDRRTRRAEIAHARTIGFWVAPSGREAYYLEHRAAHGHPAKRPVVDVDDGAAAASDER